MGKFKLLPYSFKFPLTSFLTGKVDNMSICSRAGTKEESTSFPHTFQNCELTERIPWSRPKDYGG
jgi:hypothetical protein